MLINIVQIIVFLFVWLGIPALIVNAYDIDGWLWRIVLMGVFFLPAIFIYGGLAMLEGAIRTRDEAD